MPDHTPGPWELWTGCSWRRFGSTATGTTVCEPTFHHRDRQPDLHFPNGGQDGPDARLIASAPCLDLMLWALTHTWTVEQVSLYDEEGVEGWRWTAPNGDEFDVIGDWSERPTIDDATRAAITRDRNL